MKKISSLQALRGLCYIGIFLFHIGYENLYGALGLSVFFVLSGFLTMYTYKGNDENITLKDSFISAFKRIKKIYLLHVITTLFITYIDFTDLMTYATSFSDYVPLLTKLVLNLTLTKTLVPSSIMSTSLNGVSWFLGTIFFIYIFAPYLIKFANKKSKKFLILLSIFLVLLQIIVTIPVNYFFGVYGDVTEWFICYCPLFRLVDFFCGMVVGKCYQDIMDLKVNKVVSYLLFGALVVASYYVAFAIDLSENIYLSALLNWTSKRIPLAILWLIFFMRNDIIFIKLLDNKFLRLLGDLNMYLFLIHNIVIICFDIYAVEVYVGNFDITQISMFLVSLFIGICYKYFDYLINSKSIY